MKATAAASDKLSAKSKPADLTNITPQRKRADGPKRGRRRRRKNSAIADLLSTNTIFFYQAFNQVPQILIHPAG